MDFMKKADFTSAVDFVIDPRMNNLEGAIFSKQNVLGLLQYLNIKIKD